MGKPGNRIGRNYSYVWLTICLLSAFLSPDTRQSTTHRLARRALPPSLPPSLPLGERPDLGNGCGVLKLGLVVRVQHAGRHG
jgi:hypothetical protein